MSAQLTILTADDVSAFVDGELGREERLEVAACARDDERVACRIAAWQWQIGLLHRAFGGTDEPVPPRLSRIARQAASRACASYSAMDFHPRIATIEAVLDPV
jgi:anti-sigma factor RsiW